MTARLDAETQMDTMDNFVCPSALGEGLPDADPYPNLAWLRSTLPVSEMPTRGSAARTWLVTSFDKGRACLADPRLSLDKRDKGQKLEPGDFLGTEPPDHTRLRRLVVPDFSPLSVQRWAPAITEICQEAIDAFAGRGSADLVAEYALQVPVSLIHAFLGVPKSERKSAQHCIDHFFHAGFTDKSSTNPATAAMEVYVGQLIQYKRDNPGDDITTRLIQALDNGDVRDEAELCGIVYVLLGAGHLSTVPVLSSAIARLLQHPGQWREQASDRLFWAKVTEEALRYDSAVQVSHQRVAMSDMSIGDVKVSKGDSVVISLAGANRDPVQFVDPEAFLARRPRRSHLAFGHGIHLCVGAHLARLELEIALSVLFTRIPTLRLNMPAEEIMWVLGPTLRGIARLPVTFDRG